MFNLYEAIDLSKFQVIASTFWHPQEDIVEGAYLSRNQTRYNTDDEIVEITANVFYALVFVDRPAKHPSDSVYYIKIFKKNVNGKRFKYYGMDWDGNSEHEEFESCDDVLQYQLILEFSIYKSMDDTQDFHTLVKQSGLVLHSKDLETTESSAFNGAKSIGSYVQYFKKLVEDYSVPPKVQEQKACAHYSKRGKQV